MGIIRTKRDVTDDRWYIYYYPTEYIKVENKDSTQKMIFNKKQLQDLIDFANRTIFTDKYMNRLANNK